MADYQALDLIERLADDLEDVCQALHGESYEEPSIIRKARAYLDQPIRKETN